jgi:hypothetical protein
MESAQLIAIKLGRQVAEFKALIARCREHAAQEVRQEQEPLDVTDGQGQSVGGHGVY